MLRTDRSLILFAAEGASYGIIPSSGWVRFGYHNSANLPDPDYGWFPYYSTLSVKRAQIIKGKQVLSGSISDIALNSNALFPFLTQSEDIPLPSFSIFAQTFDTAGGSPLNRFYMGGRIGRASLSAVEGEPLKVNIDEMQFVSTGDNRTNSPTGRFFTFVPSDVTAAVDGDRWVFSGASIVFNGTPLMRVRRFTLDIDNGLSPYYGLHVGTIDSTQSPIRILTSSNKYTLTIETDFVDEAEFTLFDYLFNQGSINNFSPMTGVSVQATFTRMMESTLTIIISPTTGITRPGLVFQKVEMPFDVVSSGYYKATFIANADRVTFL